MIQWCGYCRHFIRECEPWDDYLITYGVCQPCFRKALVTDVPDRAAVREIQGFFRGLQQVARSGSHADVGLLLQESRRLRITPMDLLLGILQPLLVEIGQLWAGGEVTVATEHRFSELVASLLARIQDGSPRGGRPGSRPMLLFNADGNDHDLGPRMAELYLAACGVPALLVAPGVATGEVMDLLAAHEPMVVGFSVALAAQMRQVRQVAARSRHLPVPPRHFLVGGQGVRMGLAAAAAPGVRLVRQLPELLPILDECWPDRIPAEQMEHPEFPAGPGGAGGADPGSPAGRG